jgi:guanylate kinase
MKNKILTISGKSGSGKTTLSDALVATGKFEETISFTTRYPRPGEIDGKHYNFISKDDFKKNKESGRVIEFTNINGNFYGTDMNSLNTIYKKGKIPVIVCDPECPINLKKKEKELNVDVIPVFIKASPSILAERLFDRLEQEYIAINNLKEDDIEEAIKQESKVIESYTKRFEGISDLTPKEIESIFNDFKEGQYCNQKLLADGIASPHNKESKWEHMISYDKVINAENISDNIKNGVNEISKIIKTKKDKTLSINY